MEQVPPADLRAPSSRGTPTSPPRIDRLGQRVARIRAGERLPPSIFDPR